MVTIKSGENALLRFTVRDEAGAIVPTAGIASFSVALVYQPSACDGTVEEAEVLGTWTFTSPSTYTAGIRTGGDGIFEVEVLPSQTGTPGILSAITTVAFVDSDFFVTGSEVLRTVTEDVLEILEVPSVVVVIPPGEEGGTSIVDDDGTEIIDDDGTLLVA